MYIHVCISVVLNFKKKSNLYSDKLTITHVKQIEFDVCCFTCKLYITLILYLLHTHHTHTVYVYFLP